MNTTKTKAQMNQEESDRAYAEFIARGGVVTVVPIGQRSDPQEIKQAWGRPRVKKAAPKE